MIHENRGLNPYIEDVARRAAVEGFLALAPDGLFPVGGYPGNDDDGRDAAGRLDQGKLRTDMLNSARFLKAHALSTGKLGVTGFCWGGGTTNFLAATLGADLQAGVPFYGAAAETAAVPKIKAPLLIQYAENDERINAMWPAYEAALKAAGVLVRDAHLSRHPARLSQQLDAALQRGGGQAGLGADDRLLQEAPRLNSASEGSPSRSGRNRERLGGHIVVLVRLGDGVVGVGDGKDVVVAGGRAGRDRHRRLRADARRAGRQNGNTTVPSHTSADASNVGLVDR